MTCLAFDRATSITRTPRHLSERVRLVQDPGPSPLTRPATSAGLTRTRSGQHETKGQRLETRHSHVHYRTSNPQVCHIVPFSWTVSRKFGDIGIAGFGDEGWESADFRPTEAGMMADTIRLSGQPNTPPGLTPIGQSGTSRVSSAVVMRSCSTWRCNDSGRTVWSGLLGVYWIVLPPIPE